MYSSKFVREERKRDTFVFGFFLGQKRPEFGPAKEKRGVGEWRDGIFCKLTKQESNTNPIPALIFPYNPFVCCDF